MQVVLKGFSERFMPHFLNQETIQSVNVTTHFRTGNMLNSVEMSKIVDHYLDSGHCTFENNFKILDSCKPFDL